MFEGRCQITLPPRNQLALSMKIGYWAGNSAQRGVENAGQAQEWRLDVEGRRRRALGHEVVNVRHACQQGQQLRLALEDYFGAGPLTLAAQQAGVTNKAKCVAQA